MGHPGCRVDGPDRLTWRRTGDRVTTERGCVCVRVCVYESTCMCVCECVYVYEGVCVILTPGQGKAASRVGVPALSYGQSNGPVEHTHTLNTENRLKT